MTLPVAYCTTQARKTGLCHRHVIGDYQYDKPLKSPQAADNSNEPCHVVTGKYLQSCCKYILEIQLSCYFCIIVAFLKLET
jgi:hypothetical protein